MENFTIKKAKLVYNQNVNTKKVLKYTVIFETAKEGGYVAYVPILPGCVTQGETYEEAKKNVKDAIKALLAALSSKKSNLTTNLGQENMTIKETVERAAKALNKKVKIKYTPRLEKQKYIDFKIKVDFNEMFNFKPDYSFEEGIKEFAKSLKR